MIYVLIKFENSLYYREYESMEKAEKLKELMLRFRSYTNSHIKVKIRNIPYTQTDGFYNKRFNDALIYSYKSDLYYFIKGDI